MKKHITLVTTTIATILLALTIYLHTNQQTSTEPENNPNQTNKPSPTKHHITNNHHPVTKKKQITKTSYRKPSNPTTQTPYTLPLNGSQVSGKGRVSRILSDDTKGSRHQRFILTLSSGLTVLIAHNIDLAPRVPALKIGDIIYFSGVYQRNPKGGVIHWTHHDPNRRHTAGWLQKDGHKYQ